MKIPPPQIWTKYNRPTRPAYEAGESETSVVGFIPHTVQIKAMIRAGEQCPVDLSRYGVDVANNPDFDLTDADNMRMASLYQQLIKERPDIVKNAQRPIESDGALSPSPSEAQTGVVSTEQSLAEPGKGEQSGA